MQKIAWDPCDKLSIELQSITWDIVHLPERTNWLVCGELQSGNQEAFGCLQQDRQLLEIRRVLCSLSVVALCGVEHTMPCLLAHVLCATMNTA